MATTKKTVATEKTTAAKAVEKKVEVKPVEVKAPAKAEVKAPEKKAETKATVAKKAEPKKAAPKKAAAKKENKLFVQFAGLEFDAAEIEKAVKADYTAKNGKKTITSVSIYVKPEDMKAYYVIDGIIGDVAL